MAQINLLAAVAAGVLGYFPGAVWYSKILFVRPWAREMGIDLNNPPTGKHGGVMIGSGLVASVAAAIVFALLAGPSPEIGDALALAVACAGGLVATSFAIQYVYENRSLTFWAINAGYHLLQFSIFGLVLALWP